jgi:hypothetical protein
MLHVQVQLLTRAGWLGLKWGGEFVQRVMGSVKDISKLVEEALRHQVNDQGQRTVVRLFLQDKASLILSDTGLK